MDNDKILMKNNHLIKAKYNFNTNTIENIYGYII